MLVLKLFFIFEKAIHIPPGVNMPVWVVTERRGIGLPLLGVCRLPILLRWGLRDIELGTTVLRDTELHAAVSTRCSPYPQQLTHIARRWLG